MGLSSVLAFLPQGAISSYYVRRYGFSPECKVVAFTGDNPGEYLRGFPFQAFRLGPCCTLEMPARPLGEALLWWDPSLWAVGPTPET